MSKTIFEFDKGNEVVRVEPSTILGYSMQNPDGLRDRSYIGEKLILIGIVNGCIYLKRTNEVDIKIFGDKMIELPLDIFSEGWDHYYNPELLLEDEDEKIIVSTDGLQEAIDKAVAEENYEAASKLKKLLNKNEEKKKN